MDSMLKEEVKYDLINRIIPFWSGLKDSCNGGFFGEVDFELNVNCIADKGVVLNSRIMWFFSKAYEILGEESLLQLAKHGYDFFENYCLDKIEGGVYWSLSYEGVPKDTIKHTYNQAFAIYALSAYYGITKDKRVLEHAMKLFHVIEEQCRDEYGYLECFTRDFKPVENDKLSENGIIAERTMNTLLHVFEGYSALYEVSKSEEVAFAIREILNIFIEKVYNPENKRQEVFFDLEYNSLIDLHSYGHDIESAWLIEWGCALLEDEQLLEKIQEISSEMVARVYEKAYTDKGLINECDNNVIDATRVWWVQAEAIVGFVNEWKKHPKQLKYRDAAIQTWEFIKQYMFDKRDGGEWFWDVNEELQPTSRKPIVEPWKCPYHNGRMCFEILRRL